MSLLSVKNLIKKYDDMVAVDSISFNVEKGDIFGLLGPNGAGKSTTINMISGLLIPSNGEILFEENKSFKDYHFNIGLVPQEIAIYPDLSAKENVSFFAALYGLSGSELKSRVEEALKMVGLLGQKNKRAEHFSGGMKRRLNIACAIAHNPKLIIMDEPTVGIDPQSRNFILDSIRKLQQRGTTIIYTSHYMEEVEEICNRILIMDKGKIVLTGTTEEIKSKYKGAEGKTPTLEEIFLSLTGKELRD